MADSDLISHQQWLEQSVATLSMTSTSALIDCRVLLCHVLQQPLSYLLSWPDRFIDDEILPTLDRLLQRRVQGEPIAYIIGSREFWSINLKVTTDVLIPRSETELLVEWALQSVIDGGNESNRDFKIIDLGTGSGAIAIALAKELPELQIVATDISAKALNLAEENAKSNHCHNISFLQGSWFECIEAIKFDLIISNPPYIEQGDPHLIEGDLSYEPNRALVAADKGLAEIRSLLANAKHYMNTDAWIGIEHGYDQATEVVNIMEQQGYQSITTYKDLANIDRLTTGCWRSENNG